MLYRRVAVLMGVMALCGGTVAWGQAKTPQTTVLIPGPLRSFERMAGVSQKAPAEDVIPLLAQTIFMRGYQGQTPTEYLTLLNRYLSQARELQAIAAQTNGTIHIADCADARQLLLVLGYRIRNTCGQKTMVLSTADPDRAFLTIDSGFPLAQLEEALQSGSPFNLPYTSSRVPALLHEADWIGISQSRRRGLNSMLDAMIDDQNVARLYWAMNRLDDETRSALIKQPGLRRLAPVSPILDFYGAQFAVHNGKIHVPGGETSEPAWKDLVGANVDQPGEFVYKLASKDHGWMAAYFDSMTRASRSQQEKLAQPARLKQMYEAFRPQDSEVSAAHGVFRKAPDLVLLFTRLDWDDASTPHVPGDVATWKWIMANRVHTKTQSDWAKRAKNWTRQDQVLDGMVGVSRLEVEDGPLQVYLLTSEIDRSRAKDNKLGPETVRQMAERFQQFANWYPIFAEFPDLHDEAIVRFMTVAGTVNGISNDTLRGNSLGAFEANVGLWQILARQGQIPKAQMNESWMKMLAPFTTVQTATQLVDAAHESLNQMALASAGKASLSQNEWIELLGGPVQTSPTAQAVQHEMTERIRTVMADQRLLSLDTVFALSDGLSAVGQGTMKADTLLPMAEELREFEMPRAIFSGMEKIEWSPRGYNTRHAELQARTDLTKLLRSQPTKAQLEDARGTLASFVRDTLVGMNYAYYEPPGAQMIHHNPVFVRAHDFTGATVSSPERAWQIADLFGVGSPASGGAYLAGSLADLPYALAKTEQDFISPENVQALIWRELVPGLLVSAALPRWWDVTPGELHAAALYQRAGDDLITAATTNTAMRAKVLEILSDRMDEIQRLSLEQQWAQKKGAIVSPADSFYLAAGYEAKFPGENTGTAAKELETLSKAHPDDTNIERLSRDFGVPHPIMAGTYARDVLISKPFPFFGGSASRLFGESWDSNNLYWARLADELGYPPVMLHKLVPELTRRMTGKIFATNIEDWSALERAMREAGEEFRKGVKSQTAAEMAANIAQ